MKAWSSEVAREARRRRGLSQRSVATEIGVHVATVSEWENGHAEPSFRFASALARLYDVPISDFVAHGEEADMPSTGHGKNPTHEAKPVSDSPVGAATGE